jgi:hypothetical protein
MKRTLVIALFALAALLGRPATASADITFFLGFTPTPETRTLRGGAAGVSMLIFAFEFDYAYVREKVEDDLPAMHTGMFNVLVQTPTSTQLYVTAGAGFYRETLAGVSTTNFGTNIGGGVKFGLVGPLRVRVDYRVFTLRGTPRYSRPQRLYVGINWPF